MNFKPDIAKATSVAQQSLRFLQQVPLNVDPKSPQVTDIRRQAYTSNMKAQSIIAQQFDNTRQGPEIISLIRQADARLEDANWSTTGKVTPQGTGGKVNIPLAIQQTQTAIGLLKDAREHAKGWWIFS